MLRRRGAGRGGTTARITVQVKAEPEEAAVYRSLVEGYRARAAARSTWSPSAGRTTSPACRRRSRPATPRTSS
ncbi:hypothetical protein ACFQV2_17545 [Actinokineospora soli]|uniref:Uncharacterized protein n=1 Tax=Actinokineospora soli TaxID=1048753 RepID=A0ABW2TQ41_9PSEU